MSHRTYSFATLSANSNFNTFICFFEVKCLTAKGTWRTGVVYLFGTGRTSACAIMIVRVGCGNEDWTLVHAINEGCKTRSCSLLSMLKTQKRLRINNYTSTALLIQSSAKSPMPPLALTLPMTSSKTSARHVQMW